MCNFCNVGAEVKTTCKIVFGLPLANVPYAGSTAAISCNPERHTETLIFQFQESKIYITCKVKCPNTETESDLKGDLALDVHSSHYLIAADEINAASSLDFNFSGSPTRQKLKQAPAKTGRAGRRSDGPARPGLG
uniref:Uncharacterized protein n=1 Tax=Panagrolaimus superbus TaxID=310955 RepID=A0A914Y2N8_9BILA